MPTGKKPPRDPYSTALHMLARRPYSVAELRRALERKFGADAAIPQAIARLRELGYLDDRKFAEYYASSLARNRTFGRFRVRRELKAKLVNYKFIEPAIEQAFEETDEGKLLERALAKKIRTLRRPVTRSRLASLCQSLLRQGFRSGDIMKAVLARPDLKPNAEGVELEDLD